MMFIVSRRQIVIGMNQARSYESDNDIKNNTTNNIQDKLKEAEKSVPDYSDEDDERVEIDDDHCLRKTPNDKGEEGKRYDFLFD